MLTPWLHSNPFVAGTTVRSDEMNTKLSGIATALQQYGDHINNRLMTLPTNFVGNPQIPEKTYINSIPYFNTAGDADLYSMTAFDAAVQLAIQKAADAAASQAAALASQNEAKTSEDQALVHRNAAQSSETAAANSATSADSSATNAANSATAAANSATSASSSATSAAGSASAASSSAAAAAGSATSSAGSAATADNRATAAAASATAAANSAAAAAGSATSANSAKSSAEAAASAAGASATSAEYWAGQAQTGGQQVYKGLWNASGNTFPSATTMGWTYKISAASTASLAASNFTDAAARFLNIGDTIIWNAPLSKWDWYADATSGLTPTAGRSDATAGRAVRAGDAGSPSGDYRFAGLDTTTVNTTTSWNSITGVGLFKEPLRGNNTGGPGGTGGYAVQNIQVSATALTQFALPISATSGLSAYSRTQVSGAWGAWRQVLDSENLAQYVQSSGMDGALGKLMAVGAFGLGSSVLATAAAVSVGDLNLHTLTGFFAIASSSILNLPSGVLSGSALLHMQYDNDDAYQMVFDKNADRVWSRRQFAGSWKPWRSIWDSGSLTKQSSASDVTAGALMAVGAFGLGAAPLATVSTPDLNNVTNTGWYITESSGVLNLPPGWPQGRYFVEVIGRVTDSYCVQRITDVSSASGANVARVAWRRMRNAGTWSDWVEPWTSTSLVKQSSASDVNAGAMMAVGAFGLGGNGIQIPNANCNDALVSGAYGVGGSASNAWPGRVSGDMMFVLRFSDTAVQQVAVTRTGNMFARGLVSGVWGSWVEVLNSNNTKKQTSAIDTTAGALMTAGAFGLGGFSASLPVDDLNQLNLTGFFRISSSTANVPSGVLIGSNIINLQYDNDDRWQMVFTRDADAIYTRRQRAGVWTSWRQLRHTNDVSDETHLVANANFTVARKEKVTRVQAVSESADLTLTIPTGYSAGDRIELSLSVAAGRVITLSSVTSMAVVNGTAGTSHTVTGPTHMNAVMVHDGTKWQLTVS